VRFDVASVELKSAGADHALLEVRTVVAVSHDVTVQRVRFEGMHLGAIPVFLEPIDAPFEAKAGQVIYLRPIPITVFYRDLGALDTLQSAIEDGELRVWGQARVDLNLNLLDRIQLMQWAGKSDLPIQARMAITIPGGQLGKRAAITALRAARQAFTLAGATLSGLGVGGDRDAQAMTGRFAPSMLMVESRYSLQMADGHRVDMSPHGLGFRVSDKSFIVTAEMLEPWRYDADAAVLLEMKQATIIADSVDLLVWPADAGPDEPARKLSNGDFRVDQASGKVDSVMVPTSGKRIRIQLARRDVDKNLAVLTFNQERDWRPQISSAPREVASRTAWDKVAAFRFQDGGKLELIWVPVRRSEGRLVLDSPVDMSAFGSPLLTSDGVIGMVQDERSGVSLN
jgi:hypothetical protein